ncbi:MAG: SDR family NAD(P)-dependent oxidoreductase [Miltoncostaeaceae bacterium]
MSTLPHPLAGARVLIAGASGGLGAALAHECFARGAERLALAGRDERRLSDLSLPGTRHPGDLREPGACEALVAEAADAWGGLDVVINASGVVAFGAAADLPATALEELFALNTLAAIRLARAAAGAVAPGGAIVTISGVIAEGNVAGMAAYGASKAAVHAFAQAFAREARRAKVRVLDARPPHTETGLAGRTIAGIAPDLGEGRAPAAVARRICDALEAGERDLPSTAF